MPKHFAGNVAFDGGPVADADPADMARLDGRRQSPGGRSSVDPLAATDRYRLVVPYSADPRRLGARRLGERAEVSPRA
jgi:hypothetical protein